MGACATVLFVCDHPSACAAFADHLRCRGLRVYVACDIDAAILHSYTESVDVILIYQDDIRVGSIIGCDMKSLFSETPIVLISTGIATIVPPLGIEAVCYSGCLDQEIAGVLSLLFRALLTTQTPPVSDLCNLENHHFRPFIMRNP